ncbi:MAG: acetyl-CoA carboxylase biotin carboxylase subunit [Myxococcales bacterium]|nr:acetyl-CoA carboxylase biotin carboxylase subunit [Myxococcales bacterium]
MSETIKRVLIANRGEIAVRIARACREMGFGVVAVASEADLHSFHARSADEVVCIGPAPSSESYLRGDEIIRVAKERGCQAIHPGYGFLSQSADFADAVKAAGLIFVGPSGDAMRLMGDKTAARATMMEAGVPVVPGYQGTGEESGAELSAHAEKVGFPLLIKAAAGGGGKGMRIVRRAEDFQASLDAARHEAKSAFGDDRVFLERYIERAHHVEIQVIADSQGNTVHLFERECSAQRRYQKIVEESPSPLLSPAKRAEMGATAVAAAKACGYENAGTVEFLYAPEDESFYFLEMNTRLQVEHPVTELVTGLDIVLTQLLVSQGEPLPFTQDELTQVGHAIECRIYAEDPAAGFAPSTGRVHRFVQPSGPGVRVDAGVESGDVVSVYYDPMVAKLIVHAPDRASAIRRMLLALGDTAVLGIETNLGFLKAILDLDDFHAGRIDTAYVQRELDGWTPPPTQLSVAHLIGAALADSLSRGLDEADSSGGDGDRFSPWSKMDGFRIGEG